MPLQFSPRIRASGAPRPCKIHTFTSGLKASISLAALLLLASSASAQEQQVPSAAPDAATSVENGGSAVLPEISVESPPEPPPSSAPAKPKPKPQAASISDDEPARPRQPKRKIKVAKPVETPAPTPAPAASEPIAAEVEGDMSASASAGSGEDSVAAARGGPSQIDGYVAKATTTATKTATPIKNVPQSISITTREQAADQGSKSLGQALTYVPGVTVAQGEGHRDQLTIRGQATTSDFYVDGVRDDIEYYRDLYNVEAIEVVKGPNAMIFGRGGSGGVVNRATKQADGTTVREGTITYGMYDTKRITADAGGALTSSAAFRINAMYEDAESFRDHFELERFGINPTMGFRLSDDTKLLVSYEYYRDDRTVDRGVPSRDGAPLEGVRRTFFGNPDSSNSDYEGHRASAILEHRFDHNFKVRSATVFADGDKAYQNSFANTSVADDGTLRLSGYSDTMERLSVLNQTDWTYRFAISPQMRSTILFGTELAHQDNRNFRDNARFDTPDGPGSKTVSIADPTITSPVFFNNPNRRRDATLQSAGAYVQNQLEVSRYLELLGGIRFDHYDVDFNDALVDGSAYERRDDVWSPRAGAVFKPSETLSFYLSYSKAYVPSVADQLNFLSIGSGANRLSGADLKPEEFLNRELGFKWEVALRLFFTGALFQLDRDNTATVIGSGGVEQIGSTRTRGGELGLTGYLTDHWQVSAGFGHQIAIITGGAADTIGNEVASVPHNTVSIWNKYQVTEMFAAGLGVVHKTGFFASADNRVEIDGYTRLDAALYLTLDETWSAQLNAENILNEDYFVSAHNNNNIMPGAPTSVFLTVGAKF